MNLYELSFEINSLLESNKALFLKIEPEVPDFTILNSFKVEIYGHNKVLEYEVSSDQIISLIGVFDATIFDKEVCEKLFVWNFKSLCSYFYFVSKKFISPTTNLIDLKIIENFLNIRKKSPENLIEFINRLKLTIKNKSWQSIYKLIHLPLALNVLPSIETYPLLNEENKRTEYPYYEIEGQINGRMNCLRKFLKSYMPHNMSNDLKSVLKPRGYGMRFLYSDFRHCEVTVLQWLSNDEKLLEILKSGADLHSQIYEIITGDSCDSENKRKLSKKIFLPVMYGCGSKSLSKNIGVNLDVASELINRIKGEFGTAWAWIQSKQENAKNDQISDYFGRPRVFGEKESYLARNFSVQGVAATVCQEKLIELFTEFNGIEEENKPNIAFSVHDGFGVVCKLKSARETYKIVKRVCESESKFCPELKMKVEIKFGSKLDKMKVLWED
jgi:hypothetical protein